MAKYIFILYMLLTTVHSQQCDSYGFMGCLEDLYGFIRFTVPSKEGLDSECSKARSSVIPCFQGLQLSCETLHVDINRLEQYLNTLCDEGSFHDEYLKHAECLFKLEGGLSICNEFADKHEKERMKYICCSKKNRITDCVKARASSNCGSESSSLVYHLNNRTSAIFPKFLCDDVGQCDAATRLPMSCNILPALLIALIAMLMK